MRRHPELGSVTIVVAALWMALFGMAALAVDAGHMYLTKRNLQDAADAAVMAGLPSLGIEHHDRADQRPQHGHQVRLPEREHHGRRRGRLAPAR